MKILSAAVFLLCLPILSYANDTKIQNTQNNQLKPYASLKIGYSNTGIKISEPTNQNFTNSTFSFNPAVGLKFDNNFLKILSFSIEAEYLRNTSGDSNSWTVQRQWQSGINPPYTSHYETRNATITPNIKGLLFNTYTNLEALQIATPYVVFGLGYGKLEQENQLIVNAFHDSPIVNSDTTDYVTYSEKHSKYNMFWQVGLGISFNITDNLALNAEYRHINYGTLKLYDLEYKYDADQFLVGTRYYF